MESSAMERKATQLSHLDRAHRREFLANEAKRMTVETVARRNGVTLATVKEACAIHGVKVKHTKKGR
jgi:hypothetical protein